MPLSKHKPNLTPTDCIRSEFNELIKKYNGNKIHRVEFLDQLFSVTTANGEAYFDNTLVTIHGEDFIGTAYSQHLSNTNREHIRCLVNQTLEHAAQQGTFQELLAMDALLSTSPCMQPYQKYTIEPAHLKIKADTFCSLLVKTLKKLAGKNVLLIGADNSFIKALSIIGVNHLTVTDLSDHRIGCMLPANGAEKTCVLDGSPSIHNGSPSIHDFLKPGMNFDAVVVTGMTFPTNTADSILCEALENEIPAILFMVSCSSFAPALVKNRFSQMAYSIRLPAVDMCGETSIEVYGKLT